MEKTLPTQNFDPILFRRTLHQFPELSGKEQTTAQRIISQLNAFGLTPRTNIGGHGIVCEIRGTRPGETTLLRADFDALPIVEKSDHAHCSQHPGVMHACGHDGHTASMMAVARHLASHPPVSGSVLLLFQPAEETGTGAADMLRDPWLAGQAVNNVFAYHNLPGYPLNTVITRPETFACASTGVTITLEGKTSHAAKPENGINPTNTLIALMQELQQLPTRFPDVFSLVTIIHATLGEPAFGTAPGDAQLLATLRSEQSDVLKAMQRAVEAATQTYSEQTGLRYQVSWQESFNAAVNTHHHNELVQRAASELGLPVYQLQEPMRWSEDVAEFLACWPGALFCVGSGESHPQLHNPDYDFPDALIETASTLFLHLIEMLHNR
ncbi:amidohydrolase [Photobacterium ganghwense]|uniref:amidohydrolase n=1 Tax=Photobacterium ganghwense TaxID=320778 RepID=UPI004056B7F9